jgi:hypothetical protein
LLHVDICSKALASRVLFKESEVVKTPGGKFGTTDRVVHSLPVIVPYPVTQPVGSMAQ